jgi:hypothetical protein
MTLMIGLHHFFFRNVGQDSLSGIVGTYLFPEEFSHSLKPSKPFQLDLVREIIDSHDLHLMKLSLLPYCVLKMDSSVKSA